MQSAPSEEKKSAPPIFPSVMFSLSAMKGIYVTHVLKRRLKQEYKKAGAKNLRL
jgi:hypothetical protein